MMRGSTLLNMYSTVRWHEHRIPRESRAPYSMKNDFSGFHFRREDTAAQISNRLVFPPCHAWYAARTRRSIDEKLNIEQIQPRTHIGNALAVTRFQKLGPSFY